MSNLSIHVSNPSVLPDYGAHTTNRIATPPVNASSPALVEPAKNASVAERMNYCSELLNRMETGSQEHRVRAGCMEALARQILDLPSEKSGTDKAKEVTVRAATAMGRIFADNKFASQKQLRKQYETPQAKIFNGLMQGLANPNRLSRSVVVETFGGLKRTVHQPMPTPFNWNDLERRRLNVSAWKELILRASALKPERQSKMLDLFATNFNDIPERASASNRAAKETMIAAYEESFIGLVNTFMDLRGPAGPEGWNKQQAKAVDILKEFAVLLPEDARHRVRNAVNALISNLPLGSPFSARVNDLEKVLKSPPAAQAQEVQSLPEAPELDSAGAEPHAYAKTLMARIENPKGDLDQLVSDMLALVRQLPRLDAKKSNTAAITGTTAQVLRGATLSVILPGRTANSSVIQSRLDSTVKNNERSPQGTTFEFLMNHLDDPRARAKTDLDIRGNIIPAKHVLTFNPHDIDRRLAAAPVWEELISQAAALKQERKVKLLEKFRENFDMFNLLPHDQVGNWAAKRTELIDAYSQSLVNLAGAFLALGEPEKADSTSEAQQDALAILRDYGPMLPGEERSVLRQKIVEVVENYQKSTSTPHPGILDLETLGRNLRNSNAPGAASLL